VLDRDIVTTVHRQEVIYGLFYSRNCDNLGCTLSSFVDCNFLSNGIFLVARFLDWQSELLVLLKQGFLLNWFYWAEMQLVTDDVHHQWYWVTCACSLPVWSIRMHEWYMHTYVSEVWWCGTLCQWRRWSKLYKKWVVSLHMVLHFLLCFLKW